MQDLGKRLFIVAIMALCIGLLFIGGRTTKAHTIDYKELTKEWMWPTQGEISDHFGTRNGKHNGIDIVAEVGKEVVSVDEGIVTKSYYSTTYGNVVFIKHPNHMETIYAHLNERFVSEGERVMKGEKIGEVGSTGRSSGPHLHFEVHDGDWNYEKTNAINPLTTSIHKKGQSYVAQDNKRIEEHKWLLPMVQSSSLIIEQDSKKETERITITVEKGDTLWDLAILHKVSIDSIKEWNSLEDLTIHKGQRLTLFPEREEVHVVKQGESLPIIAEATGKTIQEIKDLNSLQGDKIYPSQVLIIEVT